MQKVNRGFRGMTRISVFEQEIAEGERAGGRAEDGNPAGILSGFGGERPLYSSMGTEPNMDDLELLDRYHRGGEEEAFAELVRRHGEWIYPSARRQLGDDHLAEDVAQGVFLLLTRKAGRLSANSNLGAWLFGTLRYCINEARRQRSRQRHYEKEAAQMRPERLPEAGWEEISPLLDDAVGRLGKKDREIVLLRFYQRKALAEVGRCLGISEDAAQKRVDRAVGKLREKLAGKGVAVEAGSLGAMVLAHAAGGGGGMEGGAAGLVEKVMAGIGDGAGNGTAGLIAKGAEKMMVWARVKVAVVVVTTGLLVGGTIAGVVAAERTARREQAQKVSNAERPATMDRRQINRDLAAFADQDDLSTPEGAWAALNKAIKNEDHEKLSTLSWPRGSPAQAKAEWEQGKQRDAKYVASLLQAIANSKLLEVWTDREDLAFTISLLTFPQGQDRGGGGYHVRTFARIDTGWINLGEGVYRTIEAAREEVQRRQIWRWDHPDQMPPPQAAGSPMTKPASLSVVEAQVATPPAERVKAVAAYVNLETVFVGYVDLRKLDPEVLEKCVLEHAQNVVPQEERPAAEAQIRLAMDKVRQWRKALVDAGAAEVYVIGDAQTVQREPGFLVIPHVSKAEEVARALQLTLGGGGVVVTAANGAVLISSEGTAGYLAVYQSAERPELTEALATSDAPVLAVLFPNELMDALRTVPENLPPALGGGPIASLVQSCQWALVELRLPPAEQLQVVVQTKDQATAAALEKAVRQQWVHEGVDAASQQLMTPKVTGQGLTLSLGKQQIDRVGAAFRRLLNAAEAKP